MKKVKIVKFANGKLSECFDAVAEECVINLFVNGALTSRISASCSHYEQLIYGYLFAEKIISKASDVQDLHSKYSEEESGMLNFFTRVKLSKNTSSPSSRGEKIPEGDETSVTAEKLFELSSNLSEKSTIFKQTGGTHIAALSNGSKVFSAFEDASRRSAVQKTIGDVLLKSALHKYPVLLTSARINETIMRYAKRAGIKIVASRSAPTMRAVEVAYSAHITLVGFLREGRMNVYSTPERIKFTR